MVAVCKRKEIQFITTKTNKMNTQHIDCQVVMLPQKETSNRLNQVCVLNSYKGYPCPTEGKLVIPLEVPIPQTMTATHKCSDECVYWNGFLNPQHLYFTSNEDIKEGDWVYNFSTGFNGSQSIYQFKSGHSKDYCKKIIASTDPSLQLPGIPESFLQEYVKSNGSIKSVGVEMFRWTDPECPIAIGEGMRLKVTDDNQVVVLPSMINDLNSALEQQPVDNAAWSEEMDHEVNPHKYAPQTLEDATKECLQENKLSLEGDFYEGFTIGAYLGAQWQKEQSANEAIEFNNWATNSDGFGYQHPGEKKAIELFGTIYPTDKQLYDLWKTK